MSTRTVSRTHFLDRYVAMYHGKKPKDVTFIVTHQCPMRCTYCYEHNKSNKKMDWDTAKRCVDFLFEQDAMNSELINEEDAHGLIINFIGGEPFLEIELIDRIMSYFLDQAIARNHRWQTQYMVSFATNGILGDDPRVKQFLRKYRGRTSISVTIDGDKEAHDSCRLDVNGNGTYDRAIKMFREVSGVEGKRNTKYTIAPGNIHILAKSIIHMISVDGCSSINCNCVYEIGWTIDHARELYYQLKQISDYIQQNDLSVYISILDWESGNPLTENDTNNWCGGDGKMLAFDTDGTILPCMRYSSLSLGNNQPAYRIGDVWNGIGMMDLDVEHLSTLKGITRQSQSTQKCIDCPIASGCGWCSAYNYEVTGTPNKRVTYICDMHKARTMAQCYHHNMLSLSRENYDPKPMYIPRDWATEIIGEQEYEMLRKLEKEATGKNIVE